MCASPNFEHGCRTLEKSAENVGPSHRTGWSRSLHGMVPVSAWECSYLAEAGKVTRPGLALTQARMISLLCAAWLLLCLQ